MTIFSWILLIALAVSIVRGLEKSIRIDKLEDENTRLMKLLQLRCPNCGSRKSVKHTVTQNGTVCFPLDKVLSYELEEIDPMALCPKCNSHVTAGIGERFCLMCGHEWKDTEEAGEHENRVG